MAATARRGRPPALDILDVWPDLVDSRTGIVREVTELRIDDDDPPFIHYMSRSCTTEAWGLLPNFGNNGAVGGDHRTALAKAVGEAVERYCAAIFSPEELIWASYARLEEPATAPGAFALYRPEQYDAPGFPWRPFTVDTPLSWTRGRSLVSGEPVLVPASFVYVPYHFLGDRDLDTPITQPISTGLACGSSLAQATLSALCEVVERDAFTLMWQAQLRRPRVRLQTLPGQVAELVGRFHTVGLEVHVVDLTADVACPTIMTIAEGFAAASPALAVSAASHADPVEACRKSLEELAHTRKFAAQVMEYLPPVPVDVEAGHPAVECKRTHLRFYCPQEAKDLARFAWEGDDEVDLDGVRSCRTGDGADLEALVGEVAALGEDVIACDLTTPDVAELGLSVVRVVVPGFHPLQMGHVNRALGGWRLQAALAAAGSPDGSPAPENPYPHPFP